MQFKYADKKIYIVFAVLGFALAAANLTLGVILLRHGSIASGLLLLLIMLVFLFFSIQYMRLPVRPYVTLNKEGIQVGNSLGGRGKQVPWEEINDAQIKKENVTLHLRSRRAIFINGLLLTADDSDRLRAELKKRVNLLGR